MPDITLGTIGAITSVGVIYKFLAARRQKALEASLTYAYAIPNHIQFCQYCSWHYVYGF